MNISFISVFVASFLIVVACKSHKRGTTGNNSEPAPGVIGPDDEGSSEGGASDAANRRKRPFEMPAWYLTDTYGERLAVPVPGAMTPPAPMPSKFPAVRFPSVCVRDLEGHIERLQPLFCVPVPRPTATDIIDQKAAIRLGKALFWDVQVGGDGATACASCHFNAGVDNRVLNTLHPGVDNVFASGGVTGPGQIFKRVDIGNDDRVGSQGIVGSKFKSINPDIKNPSDLCDPDQSAPFLGHRRVTGRKTPSVIGAVYNLFNFWDGRAQPNFNGFDPFGDTANATNPQVLFSNGSLASQAVGPPNNSVEMSCADRPFNGPNSLGAKLLPRQALQFQLVSASDSVLGEYAAWPEKGLMCWGKPCTYMDLVTAAFGSKWQPLARDHFSRLWGQALQAYMSTLIPDQSRLDQYLSGKVALFTTDQARGLDIFKGKGRCTKCHAGAELTDASVNYSLASNREDQGNDEGFHNIGVTPTSDDYGRGSIGPGGAPLSRSSSDYDLGAFKTPGLRNVKLTAPYFHNGSKATLESVVEFYAHNGGDAANSELTLDMEDIRLRPNDKLPLVEFLRNGLTDCRVEKERAPFDHPALPLPNGQDLSAVGMTGRGSCRLAPNLPPTTVNCLISPYLCQSDDALLGTSIYLDLTAALPSSQADLTPFTSRVAKNIQTKITALLDGAPRKSLLARYFLEFAPNVKDTTEVRRLTGRYYYRRLLRRDPTAAELSKWGVTTDENAAITAILTSAEYRTLAIARDDI